MSEFRPKIVIFCCNWCTCAGEDPKEVLGLDEDSGTRIIRIMCSGRVEPSFVIEAFESGADGVMVTGCELGSCHYTTGNYKARRRMYLLQLMLPQFGIEADRLKFTCIPNGNAEEFRKEVKDFNASVVGMGPLGRSESEKKVGASV